jgi:hypothetical protein
VAQSCLSSGGGRQLRRREPEALAAVRSAAPALFPYRRPRRSARIPRAPCRAQRPRMKSPSQSLANLADDGLLVSRRESSAVDSSDGNQSGSVTSLASLWCVGGDWEIRRGFATREAVKPRLRAPTPRPRRAPRRSPRRGSRSRRRGRRGKRVRWPWRSDADASVGAR